MFPPTFFEPPLMGAVGGDLKGRAWKVGGVPMYLKDKEVFDVFPFKFV